MGLLLDRKANIRLTLDYSSFRNESQVSLGPTNPQHVCYDNLHAQSHASSMGEVINLLHLGPFQQEPYVFLYLEI